MGFSWSSVRLGGDVGIVADPASALIAKLGRVADLCAEDIVALNDICGTVRTAEAGSRLVREGEQPRDTYLLLEGWGYRYKVLRGGSRQIIAFLLPGDFCGLECFIENPMDHSIGLLTDAKFAQVPREQMCELFAQRPSLAKAFWWSTLAEQAILREWVANLGQRDAYDRVAHLFAELWVRLQTVGLTDEGTFALPLTQAALADTIGLTAVHLNRILRRMRADGLINYRRGSFTIEDAHRLMRTTDFKPNYLHLGPRDRSSHAAPHPL